MRYSNAGLPGSEVSMIFFVYPASPSFCLASSTEKTSTSTRFKDFFRYGRISVRTARSEKGRARRKAVWAPYCDIRFCKAKGRQSRLEQKDVLTLNAWMNGITRLSFINPFCVSSCLTFASSALSAVSSYESLII